MQIRGEPVDTWQQIVQELNTSPDNIDHIKALDETSQEKLLRHVQEARKANEQHIHESMHEALGHFPRWLRKPVKKVFGL